MGRGGRLDGGRRTNGDANGSADELAAAVGGRGREPALGRRDAERRAGGGNPALRGALPEGGGRDRQRDGRGDERAGGDGRDRGRADRAGAGRDGGAGAADGRGGGAERDRRWRGGVGAGL